MIDTEGEIIKQAEKITEILVKKLGVRTFSLCICGSGKKYRKCCENKSGIELLFTSEAIKKVLEFKSAKGGAVTKMPLGLFRVFEKTSSDRFKCLYPNCPEKTVDCHLVPNGILKSNFGDECLEFKQDESETGNFIKTPTKRAGICNVFCAKHDNNLFEKIDTMEIDYHSQEQLFLLAFKAISFSARKAQIYFGIAYQTEVIRPILEAMAAKKLEITDIEIDISFFQQQYLSYTIIFEAYKEMAKALGQRNWGYCSYFKRLIQTETRAFYAGFVNPLYDLDDKRINSPKIVINMTCNIFKKGSEIHVVIACPGPVSKKLYQNLLKQLKSTCEKTFKNAINAILTYSLDKPLIPIEYKFEPDDLEKIQKAQKEIREKLKSKESDHFSLIDTKNTVDFIK